MEAPQHQRLRGGDLVISCNSSPKTWILVKMNIFYGISGIEIPILSCIFRLHVN